MGKEIASDGISPERTVREVLANHPRTVAVFAKRGLDVCCGGVHTIRTAAMARGADLEALLAELREAAGCAASPAPEPQAAPRVLKLDVRGLEPPEPMVRILSALPDVGPGDVLEVLHFREPFPLYSRLEEAGFDHEIVKLGEGLYRLSMRRKR